MAVSQEFIRQVSEALQSLSNSLENENGYPRGAELIISVEDIDNTISVPGVKYNSNPAQNENAVAQAYVQIPWSILSEALTSMQTATETATAAAEKATEAAGSVGEAIATANAAAENADAKAELATTAAQSADESREQIESNESTRQSNESTRQSNESTRQSNESRRVSAESGRVTAESGRVSAESSRVSAETAREQQASSDHTRAENDHDAIENSLTAAGNVNAQLDGMTVTITNRNGVASSVNIGFEIYATYASKAAMNADAANVPQGKFVMIATTDPTSADNATLWSRNSSPAGSTTPFSFLSDLDQASSAAWADWLDNMKPTIEAKITQAETDHGIAVTDHSTAGTDHSTAVSDHSTANSDHSIADSDHNTASSDHTQADTDHSTADSDHAIAESDHSTASSDHIQAGTDHSTADSDHTIAESDHATAGTDHGIAVTDHTTAESDHNTADTDHSQATSDHDAAVTATANANTQAGYAENVASHPPYIADGTASKPGDAGYVYQWDYANQVYVKGIRVSLDWSTMPEEEKEAIEQDILNTIGFDDEPTENSEHAVTSGGLYTVITALDNRLKEAEKVASQDTISDLVSEIV